MKIGQQVTIKDGSYMTTFVNGQLSHSSKNIEYIGHNRNIWTVIAVNGRYPTENNQNNRLNNTIIQNNKNKEVWYCIDDICLDMYPYLDCISNIIPEYTMEELEIILGHKFKIKIK